ncbi:MAG TPA: hypothetical protein EYQ81_00675, partial [Sneathiellales bacterium]|nr:hypothetical protein [Sneathiellales bacterium]
MTSDGSAARPRRSVLYMPGSNARALEKAKGLPADALILDLEDAVAPDAKAEARAQVCAAVHDGGYGDREIIIRVNGADTPWGDDDLKAAAVAGAEAILIPKVESAQMVQDAAAKMTAAGAPDGTNLWCMMETPRGILQAEEIAGSNPRLKCFVMGTSDLTKDLHALHTLDRTAHLSSSPSSTPGHSIVHTSHHVIAPNSVWDRGTPTIITLQNLVGAYGADHPSAAHVD